MKTAPRDSEEGGRDAKNQFFFPLMATQEPKRQQACPTYAPGSDSNSGEEQGVNLKVKLQTAGAGKDMQLGQGLVGRA